LKEIYSADEESNEDVSKTKNKLLNKKRQCIKLKKEDFSKLNGKEKVDKMTKLSKLVKRYRRKYQCLQTKVKNNIQKIFYKHLCEKLKINYKNKYLNHNLNMDLFNVVKALTKLHSFDGFEYSDQKHAVETLINLLADGKMPLDSIAFKKICTQMRLLLPKEATKYINKKGSQITIQFPEREIKIGKREYEMYQQHINNNEVLRKVFGIERDINVNVNVNNNYNCTGVVPQQNMKISIANANNGNNTGLQFLPVFALPVLGLPEMGAMSQQQPFFIAMNGDDDNNCAGSKKGNYFLLVPQQMNSMNTQMNTNDASCGGLQDQTYQSCL